MNRQARVGVEGEDAVYFGAQTPEAQEAIQKLGKFVRDRLRLEQIKE